MSSLIEKPDGSIVLTVRLTIRDPALIAAIRAARPRKLASTLVNFMLHGMPRKDSPVEEEDDDFDLSGLAEII